MYQEHSKLNQSSHFQRSTIFLILYFFRTLTSMNWTGGRLRRQSNNRPYSILRIQKQHFAKARLKQREAHQKKHLTSRLGLASASDVETLAESSYCTAESQQVARSSQPINPTNEFIERIRPKNNSLNESTSSNGLAFINVNNVEVHISIQYRGATLTVLCMSRPILTCLVSIY